MERIVEKIVPLAAYAKLHKKKRVCAYARVSSGKDAMLHSLSAQVSHYNNYIQCHRKWEYVGVYTDEAVTGTKNNREGFQKMIADCRAGKIDIIITKSISRFARNTVTLLETIRELKGLNVDVYFEREKIHSISADGELLLTILASYAQEESRSVSENCKWRVRDRIKKGELVSFTAMYGFDIKKKDIALNKGQTAVLQMIFNDYIKGLGGGLIARKLNALGVPAYHGGKWHGASINALIKNEKLAGNALLQKAYVADHLTKKVKKNKGELPQVYVENSHAAVIDKDTFNQANQIREQRAAKVIKNPEGKKPNVKYPFTSKIFCDNCGRNYKRRTIRGKHSWNCSNFMEHGKTVCHAKQIPENTLIATTAEVLGLGEFDEKIFAEQILQIRVPAFNTLVYIFRDGREVAKTWQDRSRSESWTAEMKAQARERVNKRYNEGAL